MPASPASAPESMKEKNTMPEALKPAKRPARGTEAQHPHLEALERAGEQKPDQHRRDQRQDETPVRRALRAG